MRLLQFKRDEMLIVTTKLTNIIDMKKYQLLLVD